MRLWPYAIVVLALSGCATEMPQDFMHPGGPAAHGLAHLGWIALIVFSVAAAIVWLLLAWIGSRRRGTLAEHAPVDTAGGQSWIVVGGFALPLTVLVVLFALMLVTLRSYPMETAPHGFICRADRTTCPPAAIRVTGRQWWFDAEYLFDQQDLTVRAPTEVHIPVATPVVIELVTRDVIHSFWVPKLHGKVDLIPGQVNAIEIRADEPGVYAGECAEFCGMQHANMRLSVIAQKQDDFMRWLQAQRASAQPPPTDEAARGRDVFMASACMLCHTIRGTPARGDVGPDLTHVASRERIAGGALPNDTADLEAWVTHAQSLKPGAQMPDITAFSGPDLRALVAYLQTLR